MRVTTVVLGATALILVAKEGESTLMLGSLLMALKGGLFASKMGIGGLLAMALAGTQNQQYGNLASLTTTTYGAPHRRTTRSVETVAEMPLPINVTGSFNETEVVHRIADNLNNVSSPITRRMMRQLAILDQLSCLPKFVCGLNTRTPSKKTSAINDYGFLIKYLFERDDDDAEQDDEEEEEDEELSRADQNKDLTTKTKHMAQRHSLSEDEEDSSDSAEAEDDPEDVNEKDEEQLDEAAQEDLVQHEPELLLYSMAENNGKFSRPRIPGINKNYGVDHSGLSGYNKEDYHRRPNPLLNTDSATEILKGRPNIPPSPFLKPGDWNDEDVDFKQERPGIFSSLIPAFLSYKRKKISLSKKGSSGEDPFANDPFFDGFRRRSLNMEKKDSEAAAKDAEDIRREFAMQRRNSRFTNPLSFFVRKREELKNTTDPLKKYEIAEELGRRTKNARQCRTLFSSCPYSYNEITTMINNVKRLVTQQATLGDKVVQLKKTEGQGSTTETKDETVASKSHSHGAGITGGVTQISHQLHNGDKVEILLKIKPKEENKFQFIHTPANQDPSLAKANKTLQEMRKALQAIATLTNQTEIDAMKQKAEESLAELMKLHTLATTTTTTTAAPVTTESIAEPLGPVIRIPVTKVALPEDSAQPDQEDDGEEDDNDDDDEEDDDDDEEDDEPRPDKLPPPPPPPPLPPADDENHFHYYRDNPAGTDEPEVSSAATPSETEATEATTDSPAAELAQSNEDDTSTFHSNVTPNPKPGLPEKATRVRPPSALPPRPSPYKIVRKKNNYGIKNQEGSEPAPVA